MRVASGMVAIWLAAAVLPGRADAQSQVIPGYGLPDGDFTWTWGDMKRESQNTDFNLTGVEAFFRCTMTAKLRPTADLDAREISDLSYQIQSSLAFAQAATSVLNQFYNANHIDWGKLVCVRHVDSAAEEQRAEREQKARERAMRDQQRRRERAERDAD